jgi:hypothetical protein
MKRTLIALFIISIHAPILNAQPVFPQRAADIIDALFDGRANGSDDDRRALTRAIIEQLVCEFPDDGYGAKSAAPDRPFSKDSIARRIGDRLYGWDWQSGYTRKRMVQPGDPAGDMTGHHFIEIECIPHLGVFVPNGIVKDPNVSNELDALVDLLAELERKLDELTNQNERIYADLVARINILSAQHENANAHHASEENKSTIGMGDRVLQVLTMLFGAASTVVGAK